MQMRHLARRVDGEAAVPASIIILWKIEVTVMPLSHLRV